jgi:hypothetical protein
MSAELEIDGGAARPPSALDMVLLGSEHLDHRRPNVAGNLPTVFEVAPMFRRAVAGYDRFQVDTYVQWAEDELASAGREREHLVTRHLRTRAELDEARELLSHSPEGGEILRLSRRIGSMLAAAADQAECIRAEAEAHRSAATAQSKRKLGYARWRIAYAEARARGMVAEAARKVEEMTARAGRLVDEAEQTRRDAGAEAEARLAGVRVTERRAAERADQVRKQAVAEACAARLQARDDVVRMLNAAREERRRADAEAAATRERLDRDAETRTAALLADVHALERRRASLVVEVERLADEVERLADEVAATTGGRRDVPLRPFLGTIRWRSRSLRAP